MVLEIREGEEVNKRKKSAYWKFDNTQLAKEKDKGIISRLLQICNEEIEKCPERAIEIWTNTKHLIRKVSQKLAKISTREKKDRMRTILKLLETPELGTDRRAMLQKEIDDMEEEKYRGAAIRFKIDTEQEDILTKHFLTRERNVQKSRTIKEISKGNEELTNEQEEIKEEFREFYKNYIQRKGNQTESNKRSTHNMLEK